MVVPNRAFGDGKPPALADSLALPITAKKALADTLDVRRAAATPLLAAVLPGTHKQTLTFVHG
jgi:hypothetical protein